MIGNIEPVTDVEWDVTPLNDIRAEIERLSERRSELMHALSQRHDATLAAEHKQIEEQLSKLWDEQRSVRARLRFGDRDEIIKRARTEERLARAA